MAMKIKTFAILGVLMGEIAVEYRSRSRSNTGSHVEIEMETWQEKS